MERIDVRSAIAILAALLAAVPAHSGKSTTPPQGTNEGCMTRPQMEALITYALPSLITGIAKTCAGSLAPTAFLRTSSGALAERYRADSARHWPMARAAMTAMTGQDLSALGEDTEKAMVSSLVGIGIAGAIKPKDCGDVNEAIEILSPLPAQNLGRLTAMLAILGSKDDKPGESAFAICPATGGN